MKIMKKTVSVLLVLVMLVGVLPVSVSATSSWSGLTAKSFGGGTGTAEDPYLISTAEELAYLSYVCNKSSIASTYNACSYLITDDLELNDFPFTPISEFKGTLDGGDHTISGLYIEDGSFINSGSRCTIKNLTLDGEITRTTGNCGAFVGYLSYGTIENCVNYCAVTGGGSGSAVGGISGLLEDSDAKNCWNYGNVSHCSYGCAGGIVGRLRNNSYISLCRNNGDITMPSTYTSSKAGGICGEAEFCYGTPVKFCANFGFVSGVIVGGICGATRMGSGDNTLSDCLNAGDLFGSNVGGILGTVNSSDYYEYPKTAIERVCNIGTITASSSHGDIHGSTSGSNGSVSSVSSAYYLKDNNPDATTVVGTARTEAQMRIPAYFSGFDFFDVWTMDGDPNFPYPEIIGLYREEEAVPEEHDYEAVVTEPTCEDGGYTTYTCTICGDSYVADEVDANGHNFVDGSCSVCGEVDPDAVPDEDFTDESLVFTTTGLSLQDYIGIQCIMQKSLAANYDRTYALIEYDDGTSEQAEPIVYAGSYYVFEVPMLSTQMCEEVTVTLCGEKDGQLYTGESTTTSVREQCMERLNNSKVSDSVKAVAADMLNYGAAVQEAFNVNAGDLANALMTDEHQSYATAETPETEATNSADGDGTTNPLQISLSLRDKVEMQFVFAKADMSAYEAYITVNGKTEVIDGDDFDSYSGYPLLRIAVKAADLRDSYEITLCNKETGEQVSKTYTYSVQAMANEQLGGVYNDVVIAMMKYGDAVSAL